jgi:hypothetical protein
MSKTNMEHGKQNLRYYINYKKFIKPCQNKTNIDYLLLSQTKSKVHRPQNKLKITDKSKYGKHKRGLYRQKHAMPCHTYVNPHLKTQKKKKIQTFIQERMTQKTPLN